MAYKTGQTDNMRYRRIISTDEPELCEAASGDRSMRNVMEATTSFSHHGSVLSA